MASLHIAKSGVSPLLGFRLDFTLKSSCFCSESDFKVLGKKFLKLRNHRRPETFRVFCRLKEGENENNAEEPPESLFMKELRRRGMSPTSLLKDSNKRVYELEEELKEDGSVSSTRNVVSTDFEKGLSNQRERSMALNSEGLEGLAPRAKLLLTLGATFFLGFWPLILITFGLFSALYSYFGASFVHDGSEMSITPPPYIDPYRLLEDERISQTAPIVK